jgi:hypothetical protein
MVAAIRAAVRPRVPPTPERNQATVEALCAVAATVFMPHHGVPFTSKLAADAFSAAYNGLIEWLNAHEQRN